MGPQRQPVGASESRQAHADWVERADTPGPRDGPDVTGVRALVSESWHRCLDAGVDPEHPDLEVDVDDDELRSMRDDSPLSTVMPLLRRLLVDTAGGDGHVVAVSDPTGRLLWVEGDRALLREVGRMGFAPGARWDEQHAGTNAPGTALALDAPVQIVSGEHWATPAHRWSCSAAPVHDVAGRLVGAVDVTGGSAVASPYALALVRAAVAAAESQLAAQAGSDSPSLTGPRVTGAAAASSPVDGSVAVLQALGTDQPALLAGGRRVRLTPRHAEILLVLLANPGGVRAERLGELLSDGAMSPVTVRAEVSRLRAVLRGALGTDAVGARPYRLLVPLVSDAGRVAQALARGAHRRALELYPGPLLPGSESPAVASTRLELSGQLRGSVLRAGSADSLWLWAAGVDGHDDLQAWEMLVRVLPYGSPRRATARARVQELRTG